MNAAPLPSSNDALLTQAEKHFESYISFFNAEDLEGVRSCLHPDIVVHVGGVPAMSGADTIVPFYEKDFRDKKVVTVTAGPASVHVPALDTAPDEGKEREIHVTVSLLAETQMEKTTLDVVYVYSATADRQIRHEITNVVQTQKAF